jgi:hypothetical protein
MSIVLDIHSISPSINLYIKNFIKQINVPVTFEIISNTMTGGGENKDTGISQYFKSFLDFFSQEKQKEQNDKTYLNSLFYSGEGPPKKGDKPMTDDNKGTVEREPMTDDKKGTVEPMTDDNKGTVEPMTDNNKGTVEPMTDYKIKLSTPKNPDIDLQNALKGTKFEYLLQRNKNKELKTLWI